MSIHLRRRSRETWDLEEALAAEQLSTFLAMRGAQAQQVDFCRQAAVELRRNIATLVSAHYLETISKFVDLKNNC